MMRTKLQADVSYLDISMLYTEDGVVIINVLNRHPDEAITTDLVSQEGVFCGRFEVYEVPVPGVKAQIGFGQELVKTKQKPDVSASGTRFTYTFPPHSFTMLKGRIRR